MSKIVIFYGQEIHVSPVICMIAQVARCFIEFVQ